MNKLIRPLSEEFLYCSPEMPEKGLYRILVRAQRPKPRFDKTQLREWKRHVPSENV